MSLNTAHANNGVLIFNGEIILLYCDGVELHFEGSDTKEFGGTKKGRIYLTSHRMIFTNKDKHDKVQSFSFPFFSMTSIELEQPIFGANFIKGKVKAQSGGNWNGMAVFKLKFMTGGAIEFGQAMLQAAKMASRNMPAEPPPYTAPTGPYYPAAAPAYTAPAGGYYGFVAPTHVFPNMPPPNSVYTTDVPPPYPGINPAPAYNGVPMGAAASAPPPQQMSMADVKAQEAAQSGFYNPYNPNYAYVPPPYPPAQYDGPPPPYAEATKKFQ